MVLSVFVGGQFGQNVPSTILLRAMFADHGAQHLLPFRWSDLEGLGQSSQNGRVDAVGSQHRDGLGGVCRESVPERGVEALLFTVLVRLLILCFLQSMFRSSV